MSGKLNDSNKQFLAVIIFFVFIIVSILGLIFYQGDSDVKKEKTTKKSNIVSNTSNINAEELPVEGSEPVVVITSNSNINNNSNKVSNNASNKTSNKVSSGTSNSTVPISYFITSIKANKIYVGTTTSIEVNVKPDNATNQKITYESENPYVARVSSNGIVTGVSPGVCYINVKVGDAGNSRIQIQVINQSNTSNTVIPGNLPSAIVSNIPLPSSSNSNTTTVAVTSIKISQTTLTLTEGGTATLTATITPSNATNKSVTWSSSNTAVATVSNGKITAKKAGTAKIAVMSSNGKSATCTVTVKAKQVKNGWYTESGNKYYYNNDQKVKNAYVDYIYLDNNGVAQAKMGSFSATLYGARAWANQTLNIRQQASSSSTKLGQVPTGGKMTILSDENSGYIKIKYGNVTGYVYLQYIYINLPDVIPDMYYEITNANSSIFKAADLSISNITGKNLYGYSKAYNSKIGKTTYYAPLLYPVAKQLQTAYNKARAQGYNLKIYDTYRPDDVEKLIYKNYTNLYNNNKTVQNLVYKDSNGQVWGLSWFISSGVSSHSRGIAIDLALTDNSGKELSAQSKIHMLDTRALRKYNNNVANTLSNIMTSSGFETLASEWWHYEEQTYKYSVYTTFHIN